MRSGGQRHTRTWFWGRITISLRSGDDGFWGQSPNSPSLWIALRVRCECTAAKSVSAPNNLLRCSAQSGSRANSPIKQARALIRLGFRSSAHSQGFWVRVRAPRVRSAWFAWRFGYVPAFQSRSRLLAKPLDICVSTKRAKKGGYSTVTSSAEPFRSSAPTRFILSPSLKSAKQPSPEFPRHFVQMCP